LERTNPPDPFRPRPFDGWALDAALALDQGYPGFLAQSFRGSNLARQVRFAVFAALDLHDPDALVERLRKVAPPDFVSRTISPVAQIAGYLLTLRARRILDGLYGSCPDGVVGLFTRLGDSPISSDPHVYRLAWSLFAEPQQRQRAIRLIQSLVPEADETRLGQSLDALGPAVGNHWSRMQGLAVWTLGWLEGMQKAPVTGPFRDNDPDLRLLFGKALLEAGRRYRNCVPKHLGYVAVGRRLYYEWLREPGAIIELNCFRNGQGQGYYSVGQIQGVRNAHLRPEVLNAIRARLIRGGVLFHGAAIGQQAPLYGLLNIFEDEDVGDTYVSFLDCLEETGDEQPIEVA
jgi:hypothetical protein